MKKMRSSKKQRRRNKKKNQFPDVNPTVAKTVSPVKKKKKKKTILKRMFVGKRRTGMKPQGVRRLSGSKKWLLVKNNDGSCLCTIKSTGKQIVVAKFFTLHHCEDHRQSDC